MMIACGLGSYDIPCDEKIRRETELPYHFEFALHTGIGLDIGRTITAAASFAVSTVSTEFSPVPAGLL
jgi:hypothetical protein